MQAGDEAGSVDFLRATRAVAETDDVGAALPESGIEGESFRMPGEWDEAFLPVAVVTHQNGQLPARFQGTSAIADELCPSGERRS